VPRPADPLLDSYDAERQRSGRPSSASALRITKVGTLQSRAIRILRNRAAHAAAALAPVAHALADTIEEVNLALPEEPSRGGLVVPAACTPGTTSQDQVSSDLARRRNACPATYW